ncbi:putative DNA-directed DNA polymerase [Helianthus anomalus]
MVVLGLQLVYTWFDVEVIKLSHSLVTCDTLEVLSYTCHPGPQSKKNFRSSMTMLLLNLTVFLLMLDMYASERRKAKMLNFSIAYRKTPVGLARDWKVPVNEAKETVKRWYNGREEVLRWQEARKKEARSIGCVYTLLGRARTFPSTKKATPSHRGHIERAAINTPVQGSAADVAMCAMLEISKNARLRELGWKLLLQVHDEVILEGPTESAEVAKAIVVDCMSKPFDGKNILKVGLLVDAKFAQNWYSARKWHI